jgi:hypothetical protein
MISKSPSLINKNKMCCVKSGRKGRKTEFIHKLFYRMCSQQLDPNPHQKGVADAWHIRFAIPYAKREWGG